ncbi:kinase-like domain-containing protein [Favolaschia claudopus]|uniref:non-specific serine/threonine protein kinase n=1 Tax=Favolaschia claudopus TaxID=2862362 RepID=A0AAW0EBT0_9AGAR
MAHYAQFPDVELVNNYRPGGFHPVELSDTFNKGRYIVLHKLGYGTYSTVWLAKDCVSGKNVSLKILAAHASQWSGNNTSEEEELKVLSRLQSEEDSEEEGRQYVMQLLDHFVHTGPNGLHRCIVTELLGPSLASDIEDLYPTERFPPSIARALIRQIAYGVRFLHRKGIVHGDLHIGNILLSSTKLSILASQEEIESYYGEPEKCSLRLMPSKVTTHEGVDDDSSFPPLAPHVPRYVIETPDPTPLLHLCLDEPEHVHVKLCDFSESSVIDPSVSTAPRIANIPKLYRAPEIMLGQPSIPSPSTDIWALAVLFHSLFTGGASLFYSSYGLQDELLREMVLVMKTKLPEPTWSSWASRSRFFDEEGRWIADASISESLPYHSGKFLKIREGVIDERERGLLKQMLKSMVALEPEERVTIEDVVKSEWFTQYCCGSGTPS